MSSDSSVSSTIGEVTRGLCQLTGIPIHSVLAMVVPKDIEFYLSELNQKSPQRNYGRSWFDPAKEAAKQLKFTSHDMRVVDGVSAPIPFSTMIQYFIYRRRNL